MGSKPHGNYFLLDMLSIKISKMNENGESLVYLSSGTIIPRLLIVHV